MKRSHAVLLLIFALALGLRLWRLDAVPPGFNQDEAANAFDPLSLWHAGETYTGDVWPLFFDMYGDYNEGLYYYLNLPFYVLLGNSPGRARLPIALVGGLSVFALYFLARRGEARGVALLAAALLAVSPWAILASRITLREMLLPPLWILGLAYFLRGVVERRSLAPATFWLGLSFYTYTPVRLFVPVMLVVLAVAFRRELAARGRESLLLNLLGFLLLLSPFLYWMAFHTQELLARSAAVDVFDPGKPLSASLAEFARNWLRHYDPRYLFLRGGSEPLFSMPGRGILPAWVAPFALLGLFHSLRRRGRWDLVLLVWLLAYPIADALTEHAPHPHRAIAGVGLYELLAARGVARALAFLHARRPRLAWAGGLVLLALAAAETGRFAHDYFTRYPKLLDRRNYHGLDRVFGSPHLAPERGVVVSDALHRGSMQVFYHYNLWGPEKREEADAQHRLRPGHARFPTPVHYTWGRFAFGNPFLLDYPGAVYLLRSEERGLVPALEVVRDLSDVALWALVSGEALHAHAPWLLSGTPVLRLLDVEMSRARARVGERLALRYRLACLAACDEPLSWATHFYSGQRLWPHDVELAPAFRAGEAFDVLLETVVPEYATPGVYRVFAGPYRAEDGARLPDASGEEFHSVAALVVEAGGPEDGEARVWEREGAVLVQLSRLELPGPSLRRGQAFALRAELQVPEPLPDPLDLQVSFFTHGAQWNHTHRLPRGHVGRERLSLEARVPRGALLAEYSVHLGLFDPARDRLLLLREGDTRADLGRISVVP